MAGEYWRVTIYGTGGGSNTQTVVHFTKDAQIASGEIVASVIQNSWIEYARDHVISGGFSFTAIKVEAKGGTGEAPFLKGINLPGVTGSRLLPMQVATVWNLFTGRAGKRHRGRLYWPAVAGDHCTSGRLNSLGQGLHTNVKDWLFDRFCGGPNFTGLRWVVRSRRNDAQYEVTSIGITTIFGTLSTRRIGVGF